MINNEVDDLKKLNDYEELLERYRVEDEKKIIEKKEIHYKKHSYGVKNPFKGI